MTIWDSGEEPKDFVIAVIKVEQIRRGIDRTQYPIHIKVISFKLLGELAGENDLEHIANLAMFFTGRNQIHKFFIRQVTALLPFQLEFMLGYFLAINEVFKLLDAGGFAGEEVFEDMQLVFVMVNGDDETVEGKMNVRQVRFSFLQIEFERIEILDCLEAYMAEKAVKSLERAVILQ
jgi:hypothetical protein